MKTGYVTQGLHLCNIRTDMGKVMFFVGDFCKKNNVKVYFKFYNSIYHIEIVNLRDGASHSLDLKDVKKGPNTGNIDADIS